VTLALFVIGLVRPIADLGIGTALVQRLTLNARHVQTAFTCCAILGLLVTAAIAIGAPAAARLAGNPGIVPILRLLAFGFALEGFAVVALSLLRRDLDFKKQFFIDTASSVLGYGGVSIVLALRHYGAWSLAWGALVQTVVASVARVAAARHPVRPGIGIRELKELLRFGIGAAGVSGVNYLALNGDDFVVGRWSGATALGFYNRAYGLMNVPYLYVTSVMSGVLFPAFAQAQTEPARLRRAYLVATRLTASIAGPILVGAAIAAPHLVRTLYGDRWAAVAPPLQILCIAGYFRALYHLGGIVSQSAGRVYSELWRQLVYAALVIGGALLGTRVGLSGVAAGVSVAILYMFVATAHLALQTTMTPWRTYLSVQRTAFVAIAATAAAALAARLLLERSQAGSAAITIVIAAVAFVPWSAGFLWTVGGADMDPLRSRLPGWCRRLSDRLRGAS
jgi:O-antigen/teichoic acid export membrane protein